jgi:DNA polymerase III delta prime subunit
MTIRKNFLFDEEVAKHLKEIAETEGKTQTQIAQEAIEDRYKTINIKKKLAALARITGSFSGLIGDMDAKDARRKHVLEKYGK